jgi:hypothetical protein
MKPKLIFSAWVAAITVFLTVGFVAYPYAQVSIANLLVGPPSNKSAYIIPDPTYNTGVDGAQDQHCQIKNDRANNGNQLALACFSVPDPTTGYWNAVVRLGGYTGHVSNQYFGGFEFGVEGTRNPTTGVESVNRAYLWDFQSQQTIWEHDMSTNSLVVPINLWTGGSVDAAGGVHGSQFWSADWTKGITSTSCHKWKDGLCVGK